MKLLLTNDDSHDSPLFHLGIEWLQDLGDLTVVVPRDEQSWKGKSMTRFGTLGVEEACFDGVKAHVLDGTPADCVNFGIYHLFEDKPDLVVSGINMGSNTGVGFTFSSGTVGACLEANIAGVPGVALSQILDRTVFRQWVDGRHLPNDELGRLRAQIGEQLDRIFRYLPDQEGFYTDPVTWNVNLPFQADEACELVPTFLGQTYYGSCFKRLEDGVVHDLEGVVVDRHERSDGVVARQGHVSVTRLDMRTFGQL